jgi:hypothetical protein
MSDFVEQAIHRRQPALVLASRSDKSFRKYPPMQRHTEGVINDLCGQTVKAGGDFTGRSSFRERSCGTCCRYPAKSGGDGVTTPFARRIGADYVFTTPSTTTHARATSVERTTANAPTVCGN